ncbi:CamS family sex pheromone protein [Paenisporosarcina sp. TG20]|uniref:CamS family sex pheromone protein n=1 Tax=Paenisporosarcina sp. TG20 TaxID=1211706 RepID=UPI0002ECDD62|nr:CamS family sex pheromone protein [Paenisporosarcina sp. TG20]
MKRISWIPAVISLVLLAGCVPKLNEETEEVVNEKNEEATIIIPNMQISDQYYRTLLPYKKSVSRGLVVARIYSSYDIKEVEGGLLRLSQRTFSPDDYFFQEGQILDTDTLNEWLSRNKDEEEDKGLNPLLPGGEVTAESAKTAPIYLAHIIEQNFLVKTDENKLRLSGISIGLAMNSIYYYSLGDYGPYEQQIEQTAIAENGKKMANEIVKRIRGMEGLEDIPITIGLFKQESRNSIVPGTYFAYSTAPKGKAGLADWTSINEEYVLFPQPRSNEKYRDVNQSFENFKQDIEEYFPNYTSVIGTGFYQDDEIRSMTIDIPIQFYGAAELIGFTQYMTGIVMEHFPPSINIEVSVTSVNGPEALVIKEAGKSEPTVHIYN